MPKITINLTDAQAAVVAQRSQIANLDPTDYLKTLIIEAIAPSTVTLKHVAIALQMPPETVLRILAGQSAQASRKTILGVKAAAAEMGYRPSMTDVAQVAEISRMAVSLSLNNIIGGNGVSQETADRIINVAKKLGWKPSILATSLRKKRS